jgi:MFS family permease
MSQPAEARPGWPDPALLVVLAGVSGALHVGKLPPAFPVLREALGIGLVEAGFLLSAVQIAGMTLGLFIGLMADLIGLRRSMLLGLAVLSAASLAGAVSHSATALLLLRAVEGMGFLMVVLPAPSMIRQLVPPQRINRVLGVWSAYMPLGTALALLTGPLVTEAWGWPAWWGLLGLLSAAMLAWVARGVPASAIAAPAPAGGAGWRQWWQPLRQTLGAPGPWLVALCFCVYAAQWLSVVGFLPSIYRQAGVAGGWVGALTALVAAINIVGNVMSGRLLQRGWAPWRLMTLGFACMAAGAVLAYVADAQQQGLPFAWRYAGVLLFSCMGGLVPGTLFSLAVKVAPNNKTVATTVGWMQQWSAFGQFAGPPLVAWVASASGGWRWTWVVTCACAAVGLALTGALARLLRPR